MKTLYFSLGTFLLSFTSIFARDVLLEQKAGYYYFTNSTTRDIYGSTGRYSLEATFRGYGNIYSWTSAGILYATGETKLEGSNTTLTYVPLAAGLKYIFCFNCFRPYVGAGLLVSYLHTKNDSPFVTKIANKWGIGGIVKTGVLYDLPRCFFLDIFLDYSYMSINFQNTDATSGSDADVSGLTVGAGIGYRF